MDEDDLRDSKLRELSSASVKEMYREISILSAEEFEKKYG